jgi:hypothetical protein
MPITTVTLETKIGRITVEDQPRQKGSKIPNSTNELGMELCSWPREE